MSVSIEQLSAQVAALTSMITAMSVSRSDISVSSGKPTKGKKERKAKDPNAPKRPASAWSILTAALIPRVRALYTSSTGEEKCPQTIPMRVCGLLKERGQTVDVSDAQITSAISFLRENPDHRSKTQVTRKAASDAGSVVSGGAGTSGSVVSVAETKPATKRAPLTDEQKAARNAKAAATRAAKKAASATTATDSTPVVTAPVVTTTVSAPVVVAPVVSKTASVPVAESDAESSEFEPILLKGKRYFYNPENNHCYDRELDGSMGKWAGIINRAAKTIDPVPEPVAEEEEFEFDE